MPSIIPYFLWFELDDDGKIIRYLDEADFSASWKAQWGMHLEEHPAENRSSSGEGAKDRDEESR